MLLDNTKMVAYKEALILYRAINNRMRKDIMELLHMNHQMTVTAIYTYLRSEQSVVSTHLAILKRAKCVQANRDGKFMYYALNYQQLDHLYRTTNTLLHKE
jgi:DNA-binding transcriptional ArsR family regulator